MVSCLLLGCFPVFRFFFFLVVVPTDFHSVCRDLVLCGFQKVHTFPADLGLSAFQVRADFAQISNFLRFGFVSATNAPRLLPFRSLIVLSIFCSTGFSCRFPRFHLCLFGLVQWLLRVSKHLFIFSVLSFCASFSGFWAGLPFSRCWHLCCLCLFAVYLHDCLGFHCDFLFPTQTCTVFCVLVRSCSFGPRFREDLASLPFKFRAVHRPAFWVRNCRDFLPSVGGASRV